MLFLFGCLYETIRPFARLWWDETVPTVVTRAQPHNRVIFILKLLADLHIDTWICTKVALYFLFILARPFYILSRIGFLQSVRMHGCKASLTTTNFVDQLKKGNVLD